MNYGTGLAIYKADSRSTLNLDVRALTQVLREFWARLSNPAESTLTLTPPGKPRGASLVRIARLQPQCSRVDKPAHQAT
jgi:hypothetical protein